MKNKTNINVVCGESITQQELSGAGILHLDPNCALNDDHITIRGQITYSSRMHTGYTTATNLTNLLKSSILAKSTSEEIQDVKSQLNSLKNNEHLPDALNKHHIHYYALNYSCIFLIVAIIGGIIWTYTRLIKAKGESIQLQLPASIPIPSPRTTNQPALNLEVDEGLLTEAQRGEDVKFHHK